MTEKADEVVEEEVVAEESDADFEAGFEDKPTEKTPPANDEAAAAEKAAAEKAESEKVAAEAAALKYRQVTEEEWTTLQAKATEIDQIKAEHRKELDRAFGKVGGLERTLKEIQASTPAGYVVDVTDEMGAEILKEYPELGRMQLNMLKNFAKGLKGTAPAAVDPKQFEELVQTTVSAREAAIQLEELEDAYPEWRKTVGAPTEVENPYRKWLAAQAPEYRERVSATNSAAIVARSIDKFEKDTAKAVAEKAAADKTAAEKAVAAKQPSTRQQRLAAAATPRGAGGHTPTETEDDFEKGFSEG